AYNLAALEYGRELLGPDDLDAAMPRLVRDGCVDFAQCSPTIQRQIVLRCVRDPAAAAEILERNPPLRLAEPTTVSTQAEVIARNRDRITAQYGLEAFGRRLLRVYERLATAPVETVVAAPPRAQVVLDRFLRLERVYPVRFATD
ncbi:MAG: hypothetical protein D6725_18405, partial [Planctomycetota bacterium]